MQITSRDLMEHSLVISIDNKRLSLLARVFGAHNLAPFPDRLQGVKIPKLKPSTNCYLSHRNAILKAKQLDWPYVCVFEDDAYPIMGIEKKLDQCLLEVPDNCATLILGYSNMITSSTYSKTLSNQISCYGSHAYVVFRNWYDRYIKFLDYFKYADCYQFTRNSILPKDKVFAVNENLFIQFCEKKSMNGHFGYIWREKFRPLQPTEIFRRGYQPIEKIIDYMPNPEVNRNPRNFSRFWFG